jgi:SAM-dependent methyltransferase
MGSNSILWHPFGWEYAESPRWNRFERFYIQLFGLVDLPSRIRARRIIGALQSISWNSLLDLGCGTGAYSLYLSRSAGVSVWGVDIDGARISDCISVGRKLGRKTLHFFHGSGICETAGFQQESMDVVLAVEVLQYLADLQGGLREIHRVLKPGGYLLAHVPALGYRREPEVTLFDSENLMQVFSEAGLEPVSITRTFGGAAGLLSALYRRCGRSRLLTALVFPVLLVASHLCGDASTGGKYRMIIARKRSRAN